MGWGETIGRVVGGYFGGSTGSQLGGAVGGGYDTTRYRNNRSGHPMGGRSPQNTFTGTFSNMFSNVNYGQLTSTTIQSYAASRSAKKRAQATQNAGKLDLAYLRAEAEKNGFNPLTVLRATGGQGSTKSADVGKMASAQFWQTFAQGMPNTYETNYDRQFKQAKLDNTLASTQSMLANIVQKNPYEKYERWIPVRVGTQMKRLDKTVARRLDILPGDTISPGDLEEILGEFHGNITSAFATKIQDEVLSGGVISGYGSTGSIAPLSTENFYAADAIKTSKIKNKKQYDKAREFGFLNRAIEYFN